jgi:hypothetical protein
LDGVEAKEIVEQVRQAQSGALADQVAAYEAALESLEELMERAATQ